MLPTLPKKNKKKEAELGLLFRQWFLHNHGKFQPCSFELKDTRGKNSFPFSEYTEDQLRSARRNESDQGNLIRVEMGTVGTADYEYHRNEPTYIIIRYPKCILLIPYGNFIFERDHYKRKSLTEERARAIATIVID